MANLKEIRNRITSVSSTMQITSAMKMVSAAKLKRAQDAIQQMRPYANKLRELLVNLSATLGEDSEGAFSEHRDVHNALLVVVTSNRGLCGAFNANAMKAAVKRANEIGKDKVAIMAIGKKANDFFTSRGYTVVANHSNIYDDLTFENTTPIAEWIMEEFLKGGFDKVEIVYNQFVNAASQAVQCETYLPVDKVEAEEGKAINMDYIFEPSKAEIVEDLIPKSLKTQLYKSLLDSNASEHGARMTAMHKATDNAKELKDELVLNYNKARQAAITAEILEIVGGAEALAG